MAPSHYLSQWWPVIILWNVMEFNTLRPEQSGQHFADNIFKCIFFIEKFEYLTHVLLGKMAAISQMIFSNAFLWMKSLVFWLKSHWSLFLRVQLWWSISLDNGLVSNRRQAIIWNNAGPIRGRIYVALPVGGDELNKISFRFICKGLID